MVEHVNFQLGKWGVGGGGGKPQSSLMEKVNSSDSPPLCFYLGEAQILAFTDLPFLGGAPKGRPLCCKFLRPSSHTLPILFLFLFFLLLSSSFFLLPSSSITCPISIPTYLCTCQPIMLVCVFFLSILVKIY